MSKLHFLYIIYYGSFLVFPLIVINQMYFKKKLPAFYIFLVISSLIFIYSRFIEPQIIITKHHNIKTGFEIKIALIGDTHVGIYAKPNFLKRAVNKINNENVDLVLIAGDLTYYPTSINQLEKQLKPLKNLKIPAYAVLGNHDLEMTGPPIREELKKTLEKYNVRLLNNEIVSFPEFTLIGLGDRWAREDEIKLLNNFSENNNIIVLTHNPDTTLKYTNNHADLTLTGHTHGGQIRLPYLYKKAIPTNGDFDKGYLKTDKIAVFTTGGLGEVGLPMRLFNPPTIDILNLNQ